MALLLPPPLHWRGAHLAPRHRVRTLCTLFRCGLKKFASPPSFLGMVSPLLPQASIIRRLEAAAASPSASGTTSIVVSWPSVALGGHDAPILGYELLLECTARGPWAERLLRGGGTPTSGGGGACVLSAGQRLQATLTHLAPDSVFALRVRAFSSLGPGPVSPPLQGVRTLGPPTFAPPRPTADQASATTTSLCVSWLEGELAEHDAPVTAFLVLWRESGGPTDSSRLGAWAGSLEVPIARWREERGLGVVVGELRPGTRYDFSVAAANDVGVGPLSQASLPIQTLSRPSHAVAGVSTWPLASPGAQASSAAALGARAYATTTSLSLCWMRPKAGDLDAPLTAFQVELRCIAGGKARLSSQRQGASRSPASVADDEAERAHVVPINDLTPVRLPAPGGAERGALSWVIEGLTSDSQWSVRIAPVNDAGVGPFSSWSVDPPLWTLGPPSAPGPLPRLLALPAGASTIGPARHQAIGTTWLAVEWDPILGFQGVGADAAAFHDAPYKGYDVIVTEASEVAVSSLAQPATGRPIACVAIKDPSTSRCLVAGLTPGRSYTIAARLTNELGAGPVGPCLAPLLTRGAPTARIAADAVGFCSAREVAAVLILRLFGCGPVPILAGAVAFLQAAGLNPVGELHLLRRLIGDEAVDSIAAALPKGPPEVARPVLSLFAILSIDPACCIAAWTGVSTPEGDPPVLGFRLVLHPRDAPHTSRLAVDASVSECIEWPVHPPPASAELRGLSKAWAVPRSARDPLSQDLVFMAALPGSTAIELQPRTDYVLDVQVVNDVGTGPFIDASASAGVLARRVLRSSLPPRAVPSTVALLLRSCRALLVSWSWENSISADVGIGFGAAFEVRWCRAADVSGVGSTAPAPTVIGTLVVPIVPALPSGPIAPASPTPLSLTSIVGGCGELGAAYRGFAVLTGLVSGGAYSASVRVVGDAGAGAWGAWSEGMVTVPAVEAVDTGRRELDSLQQAQPMVGDVASQANASDEGSTALSAPTATPPIPHPAARAENVRLSALENSDPLRRRRVLVAWRAPALVARVASSAPTEAAPARACAPALLSLLARLSPPESPSSATLESWEEALSAGPAASLLDGYIISLTPVRRVPSAPREAAGTAAPSGVGGTDAGNEVASGPAREVVDEDGVAALAVPSLGTETALPPVTHVRIANMPLSDDAAPECALDITLAHATASVAEDAWVDAQLAPGSRRASAQVALAAAYVYRVDVRMYNQAGLGPSAAGVVKEFTLPSLAEGTDTISTAGAASGSAAKASPSLALLQVALKLQQTVLAAAAGGASSAPTYRAVTVDWAEEEGLMPRGLAVPWPPRTVAPHKYVAETVVIFPLPSDTAAVLASIRAAVARPPRLDAPAVTQVASNRQVDGLPLASASELHASGGSASRVSLGHAQAGIGSAVGLADSHQGLSGAANTRPNGPAAQVPLGAASRASGDPLMSAAAAPSSASAQVGSAALAVDVVGSAKNPFDPPASSRPGDVGNPFDARPALVAVSAVPGSNRSTPGHVPAGQLAAGSLTGMPRSGTIGTSASNVPAHLLGSSSPGNPFGGAPSAAAPAVAPASASPGNPFGGVRAPSAAAPTVGGATASVATAAAASPGNPFGVTDGSSAPRSSAAAAVIPAVKNPAISVTASAPRTSVFVAAPATTAGKSGSSGEAGNPFADTAAPAVRSTGTAGAHTSTTRPQQQQASTSTSDNVGNKAVPVGGSTTSQRAGHSLEALRGNPFGASVAPAPSSLPVSSPPTQAAGSGSSPSRVQAPAEPIHSATRTVHASAAAPASSSSAAATRVEAAAESETWPPSPDTIASSSVRQLRHIIARQAAALGLPSDAPELSGLVEKIDLQKTALRLCQGAASSVASTSVDGSGRAAEAEAGAGREPKYAAAAAPAPVSRECPTCGAAFPALSPPRFCASCGASVSAVLAVRVAAQHQ